MMFEQLVATCRRVYKKKFQSRSNTVMQNLQLCHCLRNMCKKFKVDIKKDELERSLQSHNNHNNRKNWKWITCISKVLQSKRKNPAEWKDILQDGRESLPIIYVQVDWYLENVKNSKHAFNQWVSTWINAFQRQNTNSQSKYGKIQIGLTQIRTPARMAEDASEDAERRNPSTLEMRMKPPGTRWMIWRLHWKIKLDYSTSGHVNRKIEVKIT